MNGVFRALELTDLPSQLQDLLLLLLNLPLQTMDYLHGKTFVVNVITVSSQYANRYYWLLYHVLAATTEEFTLQHLTGRGTISRL